MKYLELKNKHQKEVNAFPLGFAFSEKQFDEMMQGWGLDSKKDVDKICRTVAGGFVQKKDVAALHEMFKRHAEERKEAMKDDEYIYEMFLYELGNHEYCITYDLEDTLDAVGLTIEEINADERLKAALLKAKEDYLESCW